MALGVSSNNNNGCLERLTCTDPKRLHILYMDILSECNNTRNSNAHARTHTHTHTHIYQGNATEGKKIKRDGCMPQVRAFLQPPMQGVVLQTYGAGNAPSNRADIIDLFHEASKWGVLIVNISQCSRGNINAAYATGKVREWFSETLRNVQSVQTCSWSWGEYIHCTINVTLFVKCSRCFS